MRSRYPHSTSSTARSGSVASDAACSGDSMITSCAPIPFILSKRPSPSRSSSPSMPNAGNLLGTTRMLQPGVFGPPPFRRYDHPSARDRVLPQLRQSNPPRTVSALPAWDAQAEDSKLYLFCRLREDVPVSPSHLRAESVFVQPDHWRPPRTVVNGHNVKPAGTFADVAFCEKPLRGANDQVLFFPGNAEFGQCRQVLPDRARSDFDKCQRLAIIADEIDLAFYTSRSVIAGHKDVPLPTQIPIGVGFSANSSAPGFQLFCIAGKALLFAQTAKCSPVHRAKHQL